MSFGNRLLRGGHIIPTLNMPNMDSSRCLLQKPQTTCFITVVCKPLADFHNTTSIFLESMVTGGVCYTCLII